MKYWTNRGTYIGVAVGMLFLCAGCGRVLKHESPAAEISPPPATQVSQPPPPPKPADYTTTSGKKPQFVLLAFDGSYSLDMWQRTLDFSKQMTAQGQPVKFTYFLSGVYFLNWRKADRYIAPDGKAGHSAIGFADSNNDVEDRISYVNRAIAEGHEIGSHANGHFDGSRWTESQWNQELQSFRELIFNAAANNDVSGADASRFAIQLSPSELVGFRAPDLGQNPSMLTALKANGYAYDTSGTGKEDAWPVKTKNGLWEFPLADISYASSTRGILSMDYNFYFKQSGAKDVAKKGSPLWQQFYDDTYRSYVRYFENNYNGTRAPVQIGSHFSEWNDGVYWEAMRDFAQNVCGKPEVYCVTFRDLAGYLDGHQK